MQSIEVKTPMGTLVAYTSEDPHNMGIFIDLKRDGEPADLNLAGTECQVSEDGTACIVSHVWDDGTNEDTTHRVKHVNIEEYFQGE